MPQDSETFEKGDEISKDQVTNQDNISDNVTNRIKNECQECVNELKSRLIDPIIHISNDHLEKVEQSYASHFVESFLLGCKMFFGGSLALVHAFFPCFARDCSSICQDIREPKMKDE
jgi:hypothetical protein